MKVGALDMMGGLVWESERGGGGCEIEAWGSDDEEVGEKGESDWVGREGSD